MKKLLLIMLFSSTLLVGCSKNTTADQPTPSDKSSSYTDANKRISPKQAIKIFNDKYPNTSITKISLEDMLTKSHYKIEGTTDNQEHEISIDSHNKKILHSETENLDMDDNIGLAAQEKLNLDDVISMNKAIEIIKNKQQNSKIKEITLENDDGQTIWKAETTANHGSEITIQANTGKILNMDDDD